MWQRIYKEDKDSRSHTVSEPYLEWQGVHAMERD